MATYHFELGLRNAKFVEDETTLAPDGRVIGAVNKAGEPRFLWVRACQPLPEHSGFALCSAARPRCACCKELLALWRDYNRVFCRLVELARSA